MEGDSSMRLIWHGKPQIPNLKQAQKFVDSEVLRRCDPYIPKDNGVLIDSGTNNTRIGSGRVIWRTPYARRHYYRPAKFQGAPRRGNYWFERMKQNGGKTAILRGVAKITGGKVKIK